MKGRKEGTLAELCTLKRGHDLPSAQRVTGSVPIYSSSGITGYHEQAKCSGPGVIMGRYGTIGQVFFSKNDYWPLNTTLYVENFHDNDEKFVYFFLKTLEWEKFNDKSAVPGINRNDVHKEVISFPEVKEQRVIAAVLGNLDDKIDLLQRQNATLEAMAEALFKQWFVVEAKEEWEEKTLGDFFPITTGKKNSNYSTEDGKFPFFTCSKKVLLAPSYSFDGAAILLSGNGYFDVKRYNGKFEAYQRTYVLIPDDARFYNFLYIAIKMFLNNITQDYRGSVINFITKGMIENFHLLMPRENIDYKLQQIDIIFSRIDANVSQIRTLESLRDTLLPKLMRGEVRVSLD